MADATKKVPNFIEGTLKTPSGIALGGINVAIVDVATNTQITTTTSINGYFNCTKDLPNGFYYIKFDDPHNRFYIPTYGASLTGLPLNEIDAHAQNDIAPLNLEQTANEAGTGLAGLGAAGIGELFTRHEFEKENIKQYMMKTLEDRETKSNLLEDMVKHVGEKFNLSAEENELLKNHIMEESRNRFENEKQLKDQLANGVISKEQYNVQMEKISRDFILDPQKLSPTIRSKISKKLKGETKEFQKQIKERATNKLINEKINDIVYKTKLPDEPTTEPPETPVTLQASPTQSTPAPPPIPQPLSIQISLPQVPSTPSTPVGHLRLPSQPTSSIRKLRRPYNPVTRAYRMGNLARGALMALRTNPYVVGIGAIVILALFFIIAFILVLVGGKRLFFGNKQPSLQPPVILPPIVGFGVDLVGPTVGNFDEVLTFRADITYDPARSPFSFSVISVFYDLPAEVDYVNADTGIYDGQARRIAWSLANPDNQNNFSFSVKVKSKSDLNNVEGVNIFSKLYATLNPGAGTGGVIEIGAASLEEMFKQSAQQSGVPLAFLKAIAKTESGVLTYSTEETTMFKAHGWWVGRQDDAPSLDLLDWYIRRGYAYNTCAYPKSNPICPGRDVRGAMQFLEETWNGAWNGKPPPPDGNAADRRNLYHVILGAGYHIQNMVNRYDYRYGFSQTGGNWTEIQVRAMATTYCTGNPDGNPRSRGCGRGGVGYDELVWGAYLQYSQGGSN